MILDGRVPQHGGWWLIGSGEWAIRLELFSLGVDAWASLMGHTQERGDSDVRRGDLEQTLACLGSFDGYRPRGVRWLRCHDMQPGSHPRREPWLGGSELPSLHDLHHQGRHLQALGGGQRKEWGYLQRGRLRQDPPEHRRQRGADRLQRWGYQGGDHQ